MERRELLTMFAALQVAAKLDAQTSNGMIYRNLGTTCERVSALGLGGYHMGVPKEESESIRIVRSAIDRGITFLDNSCDYHTELARSAWVRRSRTDTGSAFS